MALDTGVTCWLMVSAVLVMLMTPGVGLFYGGLVRKKNFISMIALSFVGLALTSIQWIVIGYSLAFGPDVGGVIGNLDYLGLAGVSAEAGTGTYPPLVFMVFQLFFAAVTITIVTSAVAERIKLSSFIVFCLVWLTVVYCPIAHWAWGGGWAQKMGLIDFAGGTVVEICSGFAALALALVIGRRAGFGEYALEPHNIPIALLGAALLWFGWFGFNAGSALALNSSAVMAFVNTNSAAAAGALAWMFASWYTRQAQFAGNGERRNCRDGCDHAGRRFCYTACCGAHRGSCRCTLLLHDARPYIAGRWMKASMHGQFMAWAGCGGHLQPVFLQQLRSAGFPG